jgi:hypothetical protein
MCDGEISSDEAAHASSVLEQVGVAHERGIWKLASTPSRQSRRNRGEEKPFETGFEFIRHPSIFHLFERFTLSHPKMKRFTHRFTETHCAAAAVSPLLVAHELRKSWRGRCRGAAPTRAQEPSEHRHDRLGRVTGMRSAVEECASHGTGLDPITSEAWPPMAMQ